MSDSTGAPQSQDGGIFAAFHALTLKGLEQSILDAQARYERGEAQADPAPSLNWAVTNQALADDSGAPPSIEKLLQEEVILWLSVGSEKLEIVPGSDHATIQASALINALKEMESMVRGLAVDRSSELTTQFHQIAITQATPTSPPEEEGKTAWEYDPESDRYIAI